QDVTVWYESGISSFIKRLDFLCSKYKTGSLDSIDESSNPFASYGEEGITIDKPGVDAKIDSTLCEWYNAPCIPPPKGARIVIGQCQSLFERYLIFAASLIIWFVAGKMYSANCISATGRFPIIAAPMPVPTILDSAKGVSNTRAMPYFSCNPNVTPKTPPFLPTSSPNTNTLSSFSIA